VDVMVTERSLNLNWEEKGEREGLRSASYSHKRNDSGILWVRRKRS